MFKKELDRERENDALFIQTCAANVAKARQLVAFLRRCARSIDRTLAPELGADRPACEMLDGAKQ